MSALLIIAGLTAIAATAWAVWLTLRHPGVPWVPGRAATTADGDTPPYLGQLFDRFPDAVALLDEEDRVVRVNPAFTTLFGYGQKESVGRRVNDLIVPRDLTSEGRTLSRELAEGREVDVETVRRRKDGSRVEVSVLGIPVRTASGKTAVYGLYREITEAKRSARAVRQLLKAVETMQIGVTITDLDGKITYTNGPAAQMHGWTPEELIDKDVSVLAPPGERKPMSRDEIRQLRSWRREVTNVRKDGARLPVALISDVVRDEAGEPVALVTTSEDISDRRRRDAQLRESEERYALAVRGANDALWDWNLTTNALYLSPRWMEMLGCGGETASGAPDAWFGRVHPDDLEQLEIDIAAHLQGLSPHLQCEFRVKGKDERDCWILCRGIAVRDEQGQATRLAGSMTDITERKKAEEQLHKDAFFDGLTGLPNRALFSSLLNRSIGRAKRSDHRRYAVLFLDLDRFKVVNDSLGHAAGDTLLIALARRLESCLRPGDSVARLGGDEFTVLLDDIADASDATRVADRIEHELQNPFEVDGQEVYTSASIGIAFGDLRYKRADEVIRDADLAMYRAKSAGRGRYEVFDPEMHQQALTLLKLETDLRRAVERNEFRIYYQPIQSLETGRISGFEALVRWQHPERGLLQPHDFVPVAEETGLILPLGWWVLRGACRQLKEWQTRYPADPPLTVSVNMSPRQFQQPDLVAELLTVLDETELDPRTLKLEITENSLMESAEANVSLIGQLAAAGIQVLIDDFGTGYSSLSYLHQFNVDTLKIDRSFVMSLADGDENVEIVRTIVTLARALGMNVIAEGVETVDQHRYLHELHCEEGQGFLFSEPVDREAVERLLDTRRDGKDRPAP